MSGAVSTLPVIRHKFQKYSATHFAGTTHVQVMARTSREAWSKANIAFRGQDVSEPRGVKLPPWHLRCTGDVL